MTDPKKVGPVLLDFDYAYDQAGNKRAQRSRHDARDTQRYAYDAAGRLTAFSRGDFSGDDLCSAGGATWSGAVQGAAWTLDGLGSRNWLMRKHKEVQVSILAIVRSNHDGREKILDGNWPVLNLGGRGRGHRLDCCAEPAR